MKNDIDRLAQTGIPGLDDVLDGGLTPNRLYLVQGTPGTGKTTLSMQFLLEGAVRGEKGLYVTLSETREELEAVAASHGFDLSSIDVFEMSAGEADLNPDNQHTMFEPSEVELHVTTKAILKEFERINAARVVIDSLSEIRLLAQSAIRYRRQILALKQYFSGKKSTVLFLDDKTSEKGDLQLESIAHGVISLEQNFVEYGMERRRLKISKLRGKQYRGGYHDYHIRKGGLEVFPRLIANEHINYVSNEKLTSGSSELDRLLGGGIEYGTSFLFIGPAGAGKSTLALNYALSSAAQKKRAAVFAFDERLHTIYARTQGMGVDIAGPIQEDLLTLQPIDPAELSPGEFIAVVRRAAEGEDGHAAAKVIIIDSLNGYLNAMPEEKFLTAQLHELLTYLGHKGIVTILVVAQHGLLGAMQAPLDASYLADGVLLFRYFEAYGEVKQAISVVKKRGGMHERTIREFKIDSAGIHIGETLDSFQGILTGTPRFEGEREDLIKKPHEK